MWTIKLGKADPALICFNQIKGRRRAWWAYHGARWKEGIADPAQVFYWDLNAAVKDLETVEDGRTVPWTDIELSCEWGHSDHGFLQAGDRLQTCESSVNVSLKGKSRGRICSKDCYKACVRVASPHLDASIWQILLLGALLAAPSWLPSQVLYNLQHFLKWKNY